MGPQSPQCHHRSLVPDNWKKVCAFVPSVQPEQRPDPRMLTRNDRPASNQQGGMPSEQATGVTSNTNAPSIVETVALGLALPLIARVTTRAFDVDDVLSSAVFVSEDVGFLPLAAVPPTSDHDSTGDGDGDGVIVESPSDNADTGDSWHSVLPGQAEPGESSGAHSDTSLGERCVRFSSNDVVTTEDVGKH